MDQPNRASADAAAIECPFCGRATAPGLVCQACGLVLPAPGQPVPKPPAPRRWRAVLAWIVALAMLGCVLLIVIGSVGTGQALALGTVAAVAPTLVYGLIVLRLDRYEPEPPRLLAAAFAWGAVGAVLFSVVAEVIAAQFLPSDWMTPVVSAPLAEETSKGLALLVMLAVFRRELDNTLDGLIYGALIGLGFAMTENILYFGGAYGEGGLVGLGILFVARAVIAGWGHAVYTGVTGAAVGWARGRYRRGAMRFVVPVLGWLLAVVLHACWNGGIVLVSAGLATENPFAGVLVLAALVVLPGLLLLGIVARVSQRKQLRVLCDQLAAEVQAGTITPAEYAAITDERQRRAALREAQRVGGRARARQQRRFFETAAELAFRRHHLANGEPLSPGQRAPDAVFREELATLRVGLPQPTAALLDD